MFKDSEIISHLIQVKTLLRDIKLELHEHFKSYKDKYDKELDGSCSNESSKMDLMIEKIDQILGDDDTCSLSTQLRYVTSAINSIQDEISHAKHLSKQLETRAEDNANMYKKAEVLINELKGTVSISRAALVDRKEHENSNAFKDILICLHRIEEDNQHDRAEQQIKIDEMHKLIKDISKNNKSFKMREMKKPKK